MLNLLKLLGPVAHIRERNTAQMRLTKLKKNLKFLAPSLLSSKLHTIQITGVKITLGSSTLAEI